jgi:hypothetical protein
MRKNEDPRLSFSTPEFKEAQRIFTDAFKARRRRLPAWAADSAPGARPPVLVAVLTPPGARHAPAPSVIAAVLPPPPCCAQKNFGKPVEWALVKDYAWSAPQLRKLDKPVRLRRCGAPSAVTGLRREAPWPGFPEERRRAGQDGRKACGCACRG